MKDATTKSLKRKTVTARKARTADGATNPTRAGTDRTRKTTGAAADIATQARQHTKAAIAAFVAVMQDASAPAAARVAAATQILSWGYGKGAGGESDAGERTVRLAWEG